MLSKVIFAISNIENISPPPHSEIPQELIRSAKGGEVDINIEDNRNDEYVARAPKILAFSGEGRKLGRYVSLSFLCASVHHLNHLYTRIV